MVTLDGLNTVPPASYDLVYQSESFASVSFGVSLSQSDDEGPSPARRVDWPDGEVCIVVIPGSSLAIGRGRRKWDGRWVVLWLV